FGLRFGFGIHGDAGRDSTCPCAGLLVRKRDQFCHFSPAVLIMPRRRASHSSCVSAFLTLSGRASLSASVLQSVPAASLKRRFSVSPANLPGNVSCSCGSCGCVNARHVQRRPVASVPTPSEAAPVVLPCTVHTPLTYLQP